MNILCQWISSMNFRLDLDWKALAVARNRSFLPLVTPRQCGSGSCEFPGFPEERSSYSGWIVPLNLIAKHSLVKNFGIFAISTKNSLLVLFQKCIHHFSSFIKLFFVHIRKDIQSFIEPWSLPFLLLTLVTWRSCEGFYPAVTYLVLSSKAQIAINSLIEISWYFTLWKHEHIESNSSWKYIRHELSFSNPSRAFKKTCKITLS